jgi:AcrR family transcriptional regulator
LFGIRQGFRIDVTLQKKRGQDRRIQKTRTLLHEALGALIREKPYDSIAVKEILDRANVGRSTFYTHFRDKDELLISGIHELLRGAYPPEDSPSGSASEMVLRFSLPVFEHIHRHAHLGAGAPGMGARGRALVHAQLQKLLSELIRQDLRAKLPARRKASGHLPTDLLAQYVASTFILVLHWWLDTKAPMSPREVNEMFRTLILPPLAATLD